MSAGAGGSLGGGGGSSGEEEAWLRESVLSTPPARLPAPPQHQPRIPPWPQQWPLLFYFFRHITCKVTTHNDLALTAAGTYRVRSRGGNAILN